ncbi:ARI10, partial [Symbiodinium sp. CCMP2456]
MARWARSRARAAAAIEAAAPAQGYDSQSAAEYGQRCPICLDDVVGQARLSCEHMLCAECLLRYVESLVNQGKVAAEQLACPLPSCRTPIATNALAELLRLQPKGDDVYQRLLDFQAQRFEPEPGDDERLVNCPSPGCIKVLVPLSLVQERADVSCPQCSQRFCAACAQPAHAGSCEDAEMQRMDPALRRLIAQQNWKRCPVCRHLCERESGCNFMTCPSEQCKGETYFCYLCGEILAASDHASHYEGFDGAIGLRGPFGSVCMNRREPDSSLPSQPPPPRLSAVVRGEEEGSIALRLTWADHRSEPPTIYYRIWLSVPGSKEVHHYSAAARGPYYDIPKGLPKYIRYQAAVAAVNVNGIGPASSKSE